MPNEPSKYHPLLVSSATTAEPFLATLDSALPCSVAAQCGGCPEFGEPPAAQRRRKGQRLAQLLAEQGLEPPVVPWLGGETLRYRNRIRVALRDGVPGYFNRDKDPRCLVLEAPLLTALTHWNEWATVHRQALRAYRVAEVRTADADGTAAVYLRHTERNGVRVSHLPEVPLPDAFGAGIVAAEGGPIRTQRFQITADAYARVPIGGFMQVNSSANRRMVEHVLCWVEDVGATSALDLFAGSGNFALPLARRGLAVTAVEADVAGCWALQLGAKEQCCERVTVVTGDALDGAREMAAKGDQFDVVIADPPRGGLRGRVDEISKLARYAVVLVGCDVVRFAADVAALVRAGYLLQHCVGVDMFPHTRHMESMAWLVRQ